MIPKKIHFFHHDPDFKSLLSIKNYSNAHMCVASWQHFCPDYELIHWHPQSVDFQKMLASSQFLKDCYKRKIWAFMSDYVRSWALYYHGGIWLDTDVQLFSSLDHVLKNKFFSYIGPHHNQNVLEVAIFGCTVEHPILQEVLKIYNSDIYYKNIIEMSPIVYARAAEKVLESHQQVFCNGFVVSDILEKGEVLNLKDHGMTIYPHKNGVFQNISEHTFKTIGQQKYVAIHWSNGIGWKPKSLRAQIFLQCSYLIGHKKYLLFSYKFCIIFMTWVARNFFPIWLKNKLKEMKIKKLSRRPG